ncbi:MAG: polysaccharide biosynthesis/export family protein [Acidobacteria bacterium]|nr:polysaccharide biosynthesis/export family protein [Acidobacteriota bacterium]
MRRFHAMLTALVIPLVTACAGGLVGPEVQRVTFPEVKPPPAGPVKAEPLRIQSGDTVSIRFINNSELNETAPVRSDGTISLALVGEVTAAGLTVAELRSRISERYMTFITQTRYGELLKEGDELAIRFVYNPELNQVLTVRSDGKISLPIIGEVQAAGVRPADLRQRLIEEYARHIKSPDVAILVGGNVTKKIFADEAFISVTLSKPAEQEVFVGGEVQNPRAIKFDGQLTSLQAIMQAGGVKETGDLSQVVVLRRGQFEQAEWVQTNLSNPLSGRSLQNDILLRSGDVLVVPMSGIAKVNLWVKQYIRDVLPLQSGFNITVIPHDAGGFR